ncbi:MAG: polysaccharide biosynthesis/export family protein [Bacteroidales bacterium]|nr:polysaccharide biosynthesis/export family protein [Bacteroidales bacterium]
MRRNKFLLLILFTGLLLASCVPQKKILYLQDIPKDDSTTTFVNDRSLSYKVQPGDNLYIKINSLEEKSTTYFNEVSGSSSSTGGSNLYLNSYLVNDTGYFHFPSLGYIYVKDLTTEGIQLKLEKRLAEYLVNPVVIVRLASFRITLLGEFKNPGKYDVYQSNINIFEAVSMGGDMTDFAKRNKIAIIRQTTNGSELIRVNMNDKHILESDYFYLLPNDIVYAEPIKAKQFVSTQFPYGLVFSVLSTILLLYAFIIN